TVGSTTFTMGSVVVFFLIIWVANFLQKYIGYFFDDTVNEDIVAKKKIGTSILLIRLLILTVGFLLGVAASGLPIDKITIVIGALGVGIGLGLQNIVNQLVSGIILAIERPIQVGDAIDIGGRSGKVKEIGIRSSRLLTADGAEIIVPNGDLLSQTITNWTMNNNHIRVEIIVKIGNTQNIDNIKASIISILSNTDVMNTPEPQILVTGIAKEGFELKVLFWVFEISKSATMKSEILKHIYEKCQSDGVDIL
ncbi:MAG: mechanosensitive ion channel domain-containing protein, partial [Bacteroidota bacterium]